MLAPDRSASPSGRKPQRPQALNLSEEVNSQSLSSPKDSPTTSALKSSFKRTGSLGKNTKKKPTAPQGPSLATEARSLVRPCNCGKDGVFNKGHGHTHDHQHKVPPSPERVRREPKPVTPRSPFVSRKAFVSEKKPFVIEKKPVVTEKKPVVTEKKPVVTERKPTVVETVERKTPKPILPQKEKKTSVPTSNRFVSTVVWYPELKPEFNTTTLSLNQGEDSSRYIDQILVKEYDNYVKKMFPGRRNSSQSQSEGQLLKEQQHSSTFRNSVTEGMQNYSVSVS